MSKAGTVLSTDQLAHDGSIHSGPPSLGPTGAPSVSTAPPTKLKNPIGDLGSVWPEWRLVPLAHLG
jgi:hypothetical protein